MATKLCSGCRGAKKIMGMGSMQDIDCRVCGGIGYVPVEEKKEEEIVLLHKPLEPKIIVKKSRKLKTDMELADGSKEEVA